jgi:acetyltransferase-like isoleucine patch superfamily enzyme
MKFLPDLFKALRKIKSIGFSKIYIPIAKINFYLNGAEVAKGLRVNGFLKIFITRRGVVTIGENCSINSGENANVIGRQQKTIFWVEGILTIGNNLGISCSALICNHEIEIGNNVTIGGNTVIYDTDFHSLNPILRSNKQEDRKSAKWGKVTISDNVFIGAHTTILKGVTIGKNAIVGACSVVAKDIPSDEIWAGNPAKFISKII